MAGEDKKARRHFFCQKEWNFLVRGCLRCAQALRRASPSSSNPTLSAIFFAKKWRNEAALVTA